MKFLSFCDIIIKEVNMEIEYKTIDEQIEEIKKKNIIFKDEENAKDILLKENYYNVITAYKDIFINIKNVQKIMELKHVIQKHTSKKFMKYIILIENLET